MWSITPHPVIFTPAIRVVAIFIPFVWMSLGQQGDKPVHPKGDPSWRFIGRTGADAEAPVLRPPDAKE